jgi:hypothetical protein
MPGARTPERRIWIAGRTARQKLILYRVTAIQRPDLPSPMAHYGDAESEYSLRTNARTWRMKLIVHASRRLCDLRGIVQSYASSHMVNSWDRKWKERAIMLGLLGHQPILEVRKEFECKPAEESYHGKRDGEANPPGGPYICVSLSRPNSGY